MGNNKKQVRYGKFKIELKGVASRTIVIPENISLFDFHKIIQSIFDWEEYHLWEFKDSKGNFYGDEDNDLLGDITYFPPETSYLSDIIPCRGNKLTYTYDFGDYWEHVITRMADPKNAETCYCVKTEGPDGIEDIGGVWGLIENKDEWNIPEVADITHRLESIFLHTKKKNKNR